MVGGGGGLVSSLPPVHAQYFVDALFKATSGKETSWPEHTGNVQVIIVPFAGFILLLPIFLWWKYRVGGEAPDLSSSGSCTEELTFEAHTIKQNNSPGIQVNHAVSLFANKEQRTVDL